MNHYLSKLMTYHLVHQMDREGFSTSKIAEHFGMNWRTTKRLLKLSEKEYLNEQEGTQPRKRSLDDFEVFVTEKLIQYPSTPAAQMHDWLKENHADFPVTGQRTVFNFVKFVRTKHNIPKIELVREYACVPELPYGKQAQIDFGFYNMNTGTHGKTRKVQFFTLVFSRSRYKYVLFTDTPFTTETVIAAHELAFAILGYYPDEIVYDQDRLFMVSENLGEIIMTAGFLAYVKERCFTTYFCRKADPESKGKVENVVKYVKQNFLYNRTFKDLETLNHEAGLWLGRTANALEHGTTKKIPAQEFAIEKEFLNLWHPVVTDTAQLPLYAVHKDNKVSYKGNIYSLPLGTYKGKNTKVFLKATSGRLALLNQAMEEICCHDISPLKGQKILASDHMRDKSGAIREMILEFSELMENKLQAVNWVSKIRNDKPRYIRDQIQQLKTTVANLDHHTASEALDYACEHQIYSANDFKAIAEQIIRKQADNLLPMPVIIQLNPLDGQSRKLAETIPQQSELATYDHYFKK